MKKETPDTNKKVTITVIYDNYPYDPRLKTGWGFSAMVEYRERILLFDTGADEQTLLGNMAQLGINPLKIEYLVLSHFHQDHFGGTMGLLDTGVHPTVYLLSSFSHAFRNSVKAKTEVVIVHESEKVAEGLYSTGQVEGVLPEEGLVIDTPKGLVLITGCAHPGVVSMISAAKAVIDKPVYLVLGGFHLGSASDAQVDSIIDQFRHIGVINAAPCHCTGENAIGRFARAYGDHFIQVGVGKKLELVP